MYSSITEHPSKWWRSYVGDVSVNLSLLWCCRCLQNGMLWCVSSLVGTLFALFLQVKLQKKNCSEGCSKLKKGHHSRTQKIIEVCELHWVPQKWKPHLDIQGLKKLYRETCKFKPVAYSLPSPAGFVVPCTEHNFYSFPCSYSYKWHSCSAADLFSYQNIASLFPFLQPIQRHNRSRCPARSAPRATPRMCA